MPIDNFLEQVQKIDLLRFTTAGSVDDGKSTLIGRLLHDSKNIYEDHLLTLEKDSSRIGRDEIDYSFVTDGLKAEREQGITIDVAYRHFSTPKRRFIIADTPGHEQYTRNMVTGASTANLAIILIDARNGVVTQSKRHGFIASLLGIPHIVAAVNKMDLVDYSQEIYDSICEAYTSFSAKLSFKDLTFIPISALKGDNVVSKSNNMPWYEGPSLLTYLENIHIGGDQNLIDFRFPVQCVLHPYDGFRGYCGTVASGIARKGDEILTLPSGKKSRISKILVNGEEKPYAFPPMAITILLEDEIDISRGNMIVYPQNTPFLANELEAIVIWMAESPLRTNKRYIVKHTTNTVNGHFSNIHYKIDPNTLHRQSADSLELNDIARITMSLYQPIFCDEYRHNRQNGSFIVIDAVTNFTVAAGMVINRSHKYDKIQFDTAAPNIAKHFGHVASHHHEKSFGHSAATLWMTGLSGSGKSTLAYETEKRLTEMGKTCYVLDGDNLRFGLNKDLGFSPEDRKENIRRTAEVARLFNEAGLIVIASLISPFIDDRMMAKEIIGDSCFKEIHISTSIEVCEQRDPKGLYKKARKGEIPDFTGISSPYEPPLEPDMLIDLGAASLDDAVNSILDYMVREGIIDI